MKLKTAALATAVLGLMAFGPRWAYAEDVIPAPAPSGILDTSHAVISSGSWKMFEFALFKNVGITVGGGISLKTGNPAFVTSKVAVYMFHNVLALNIGGTAVGGNGGTFTLGPAINAPEILKLLKLDKIFPPFKYTVGGIQGIYMSNKIYRKDNAGNPIGNGTHFDAIPWGGFQIRIPL